MATADLEKKIDTEAEQVIRAMATKTAEAVLAIEQEADGQIKALMTLTEAEAVNQAEDLIKRSLAKINSDHRQAAAKLKRQLIEEIIKQAKQKFQNQPAVDYLAWLQAGLSELPSDFAGQIRLADKYPDQAKELVAKLRPAAQVTIDPLLADGWTATEAGAGWQFTFDQLLNRRRSQLEIELNGLLFT